MKPGVENLLPAAPERQTASVTPIRRGLDSEENDAWMELIRRLAADRLRDLRDDGVTVAYLARMYGVEQGLLEEVINSLGAGMR